MSDSIYEFVMASLAASNDWKAVAAGADVPYSTVYKIGKKIVADPGVSLVEKLATYFRKHPVRRPKNGAEQVTA
jgi:hypothetical protein